MRFELHLPKILHNASMAIRTGRKLRDVVYPGTGACISRFMEADAVDIADFVHTSSSAQTKWAATTSSHRANVLHEAARLLHARRVRVATLETFDTGRTLTETLVDVDACVACLRYVASCAALCAGTHVPLEGGDFCYVRREPVGVCVGIGAWNYPLLGAVWKAAPALGFGNTMLFKPSEHTVLTALELERIFADAGLPSGCFTPVLGSGDVGHALATHPAVSKVSVTGSVTTGSKVWGALASAPKAVTMELGGKSPLVIFSDADLKQAVDAALMANFYSSGQVCSNGTRVFVHRDMAAAFLNEFASRADRLVVGDPFDPATHMGPLISAQHRSAVLGHVDRGLADGACLCTHGHPGAVSAALQATGGFYMRPAVFANCHDGLALARQEIFGPVATVMLFSDEDEVIARANDTDTGLAAGVFTRDLTRAHRVVNGVAWINTYNTFPMEMPWGGVKRSGLGRENGADMAQEWTTPKAVHVAVSPIMCPYP